MKPIRIHLRESLYLSIPPRSEEPDRPCLDDGDSDPVLMTIRPFKKPVIMTTNECFKTLKRFRDYKPVHTIHDSDSPANRLIAICHPDLVLNFGPRCYVIGPVVVCAADRDGYPVSLDLEQIHAAADYFKRKSVQLCLDDADLPLPAFSL